MPERERLVGAVLTGVVALNRGVTAAGRTPFGGIELTTNQLGLLFLLAHSREPLTPGAAATALHITPGAVTQLVDPLRAAGLVETLPHPGDRRSRILRLTDAERERLARDANARASLLGNVHRVLLVERMADLDRGDVRLQSAGR